MKERKPIRVIGARDPREKNAINTTSSCKGMGRQFSPFILGPVNLYAGAVVPRALNVENAWQFSKVYKCHTDDNGDPTDEYFEWAKKGWNDTRAHRYPMGKGAIPEYSWWDGKKLGYIEARKRIYFSLYAGAVSKTKSFKLLKEGYEAGKAITLWDYDGYNYLDLDMTLKDVINDPSRPMGHAFVLAALIQEEFKKVSNEEKSSLIAKNYVDDKFEERS